MHCCPTSKTHHFTSLYFALPIVLISRMVDVGDNSRLLFVILIWRRKQNQNLQITNNKNDQNHPRIFSY